MANQGSWLRQFAAGVLATFGIAWLWVSMVAFLFSLLGIQLGDAFSASFTGRVVAAIPALDAYLASHEGMMFLLAVIVAPLMEETLFRMLPLSLALVLYSLLERKHAERGRQLVQATLIGVCFVLFGLVHGSVINIFIQGVVGLVLGMLYLKYSKHQLKAYMACVLVHALYNFSVFAASGMS